jgi:hypothetical protein
MIHNKLRAVTTSQMTTAFAITSKWRMTVPRASSLPWNPLSVRPVVSVSMRNRFVESPLGAIRLEPRQR